MSKARSKGLGRGFESLIPTELFDETFDPTGKQDAHVTKLVEIDLELIDPTPDQPRKNFDQAGLKDLAESIKIHGVLQPIVVTKAKGGRFQIVAGERRFRASQLAGAKTIPALVRTLNAQNKLELSLIENVQRQDLNVIEVATSYLKLRDQFNLTLQEIGQRVGGKSTSGVSNTIRLLRLPKEIIQALRDDLVTEGQVRSLVSVEPELAKKLLPQIIKENWSARRVERVVANYKRGQEIDKTIEQTKNKIKPKDYRQDETLLAKKLALPVKVKSLSRGGGRLEIKFKDLAEFERLKKALLKLK